jgi:hypothetical protein
MVSRLLACWLWLWGLRSDVLGRVVVVFFLVWNPSCTVLFKSGLVRKPWTVLPLLPYEEGRTGATRPESCAAELLPFVVVVVVSATLLGVPREEPTENLLSDAREGMFTGRLLLTFRWSWKDSLILSMEPEEP